MKPRATLLDGLTTRPGYITEHLRPRALRPACRSRAGLRGLANHRFPLERAVEAFRLNAAYEDKVVKAIVESCG